MRGKRETQCSVDFDATLSSRYLVRAPAEGREPRELILLLHGYQQSGRYALGKFAACCPANAVVVAPDAPFPVPERKGEAFRLGFSWYFYDPVSDRYVVDMGVSLIFLAELVGRLGFADLPKRIVGYSQGGYLAPFVASRLRGVTQVVGVSCEFLADEMKEDGAWPPAYRMDSVHGGADEIVEPANARRGHAALQGAGARVSFREVSGEGHRITEAIQRAVAEALAE